MISLEIITIKSYIQTRRARYNSEENMIIAKIFIEIPLEREIERMNG